MEIVALLAFPKYIRCCAFYDKDIYQWRQIKTVS